MVRADARRNRERIVAAALERFSACGPAVSMEDIARAAGLGVGTLYRHFPDRRALAGEIAADAAAELVEFLRIASGGGASAWEVLRDITRHAAGLPLALAKKITEELPSSDRLEALAAESDALLAEIIERGRGEGSIRADLETPDILALFGVVACRPGATPGDPAIMVMLDGLRPQPGNLLREQEAGAQSAAPG